MKKILFTLLFFQTTTYVALAQKAFHASINKTNIPMRGGPVVMGQVMITAPAAGKVMVRFDGECISTPGDRIVLAASRTQQWGNNDNSVVVNAISTDLKSNVFSHTRVYDVPAGEQTFYAIAENYAETAGNGIASVYGSLTAEWFPEASGQAFVRHNSIVKNNFNVEGAPVILAEQPINIPAAGKIVVRFDGYCISSSGDLLMLAASNSPGWGSYDGSSSIEIPEVEFDKSSFAHTRTYDVTPGNQTYYAVIENYYEIYGNGIASVFGSLTVSYYPETSAVVTAHTGISQVGVNIEGSPVTMGEVSLVAPVSGKVVLNFSGTCIGSFGDFIKLAASDSPQWTNFDGGIGFEPFSSDRNRASFSHTRVFEVAPGTHPYYAVAQNVFEFFGSGLAVVYGSLDATFYPNTTVGSHAPELSQLVIMPNPANDRMTVDAADLPNDAFDLTILDEKGAIVKSMVRHQNHMGQIDVDISMLPKGKYFLHFQSATGQVAKPFIRL